MNLNKKKILIIGAGPAGITAGIELQKKGIKDITIIESDNQVGGISKTINYKNNYIDIGGHRFFSKSDWVMQWWTNLLPIEKNNEISNIGISYQGKYLKLNENNFRKSNSIETFLIRNRISRIFFNKKFFSYPLKINLKTIYNLGIVKTFFYGCSYLKYKITPIKPEKSLEDFLINRFGMRLYRQFFKDYTEKVWGTSCDKISASWGAQRIKSLSILKAILHYLKSFIKFPRTNNTATSLIEYFIYPKFGPGQLWKKASQVFIKNGGSIIMNSKVTGINFNNNRVESLIYEENNKKKNSLKVDYLISTMPIKDLIKSSKQFWSAEINKIAENLTYRDFITVGLLYPKTQFPQKLKDNWIYIQEPGVKVGRVQVFNNWSPYMVSDKNFIWLGLEYFCNESDNLWKMDDKKLIEFAENEIHNIGLVTKNKSSDGTVIRVPKAYPGYFGEAFKKFDTLRYELDKIENLFLIGRNGMHRYNNQDHSMLTAKEAVNQIVSNKIFKDKIWNINIDDSYHEETSK